MKISLFYIFFGIILIFGLTGCVYKTKPQSIQNIQNTNFTNQEIIIEDNLFLPPIADYQTRVTKKPFGIYITPATSPVSPEKFDGYHTGTDFEILPGEAKQDILISAICQGELTSRRTATGYGGVAVQSCLLDGQDITVIYGHLDLTSISAKVGDILKAGDSLGFLGKEYSSETDGERQHLHLGIHKGKDINIRGYVSSEAELENWYDPMEIINL